MKSRIGWLLWAVLAMPVLAATSAPGAAPVPDGAKPPYGRGAAPREACKADPEKCQAEAQARREACAANPEPCRKARMAQREQWCAQHAEQCAALKAGMAQRRARCQADPEQCRQEHAARAEAYFKKTDKDGNGLLSRAEAEQGMPRLARRFDLIDVNQDGQVTREEMAVARKARQGVKPLPGT